MKEPEPDHRVVSHLGALLEERGLTLVQLAQLTGVTVANLSILKNGRARAIRYTTLTAVCDALGVAHIDMPLTAEKVWRALSLRESASRLAAE